MRKSAPDRAVVRGILQDPSTPAYQRLQTANALHIGRGRALEALTGGERAYIAATRDITPATIARVLAIHPTESSSTGSYTGPRRSRNSGPRDLSTCPPTHTARLQIMEGIDRTHGRGTFDACKTALKDAPVLGWYEGAPSHAWRVRPEHAQHLLAQYPGFFREVDTTSPVPTITRADINNAARQVAAQIAAPAIVADGRQPAIVASDTRSAIAPSDTQSGYTVASPDADTLAYAVDAGEFTALFTDTEKDTMTTTTETIDLPEYLYRCLWEHRGDAAAQQSLISSEIMRAAHAADVLQPLLDRVEPPAPNEIGDIFQLLAIATRPPVAVNPPDLGAYIAQTPTDVAGATSRWTRDTTAYAEQYAKLQAHDALYASDAATFAEACNLYRERADADKAAQREIAALKAAEEAAQKAREAASGAQSALLALRAATQALAPLQGGTRPSPSPSYVPPASLAALYDGIAYALVTRPTVPHMLFTGPTGTGKTVGARELAARIGLDLYILNCQTARDAKELFADKTAADGATHWELTDFALALQRGNCLILLDELNRASAQAQNAFFSLLDGQKSIQVNGVGTIHVGPHVIFAATINEGAAYSGTNSTDAALRNRFGAIVEVGYLTPAQMVDIADRIWLGTGTSTPAPMIDLSGYTPRPYDRAEAAALANAFDTIAKEATRSSAGMIQTAEGMRAFEHTLTLLHLMGQTDISGALQYGLLNRWRDADERRAVDVLVTDTLSKTTTEDQPKTKKGNR